MRFLLLVTSLILLSCSNHENDFDINKINGLWFEEIPIDVRNGDTIFAYTYFQRDASLIIGYFDGDTSIIPVEWINEYEFQPKYVISGQDTFDFGPNNTSRIMYVDDDILVMKTSDLAISDTLSRAN